MQHREALRRAAAQREEQAIRKRTERLDSRASLRTLQSDAVVHESGTPPPEPNARDQLPSTLLAVLGSSGSPQIQQRRRHDPVVRQERRKKAKLSRKISEVWKEAGVQLKVNKPAPPVAVSLSAPLKQFMADQAKNTPRTKVQHKRKRSHKKRKM